MPIDPVCGIELDEDLAVVHEHDGKKYHLSCDAARKTFIRKPQKWKKQTS